MPLMQAQDRFDHSGTPSNPIQLSIQVLFKHSKQKHMCAKLDQGENLDDHLGRGPEQ